MIAEIEVKIKNREEFSDIHKWIRFGLTALLCRDEVEYSIVLRKEDTHEKESTVQLGTGDRESGVNTASPSR